MSYLRTNYRLTGKNLDITAIGGGIPKASIFGGAGTLDKYGGFIMGSVATSEYVSYSQSAFGAMSDWFGSVNATMIGQSGYRIRPMGYNIRAMLTSVDIKNLLMCEGGAGDSIFTFSQGVSGSIATSCASLGFVWWGLIISTP